MFTQKNMTLFLSYTRNNLYTSRVDGRKNTGVGGFRAKT